MKDSSSALHRRLAAALARIETVTRSQARRVAQEQGLSLLQVRALAALDQTPGLRVGALARELQVTAGTISAAVSVLDEKGLVLKQTDPREHRTVVLELTVKGRRLHHKLEAWPDKILEPLVEDLGEENAGQILDALLRSLHSFERRGWIDHARMCFGCEFFAPWKGKGKRPHRCNLLKSNLAPAQLQVNCPDFAPLPESARDSRWKELKSSG